MITKEEFEELAGIKLVELDGKLFFGGTLNLENKNIKELPDNLFVYLDLILTNSSITKLSRGLEVGSILNISGTEIEEIPEDTKFGDGLYVNDMKRPFSFPKIVKNISFFECKNTNIKRMPEEIYVKYICDFSYSKFTKAPKIIEVGYELSFKGSYLTEFPNIKKEIYYHTFLKNSSITKLPKHFTFYKNLIISGTHINELSEGLVVGDCLDLRNTNLNNYSNLHTVCSNFILDSRKYYEIKDTLAPHKIDRFFNLNETVYIIFEPNYNGAYLFKNKIGKYIKVDGIFGKIVEQKDNVYQVQINSYGDITYLVTDGVCKWSHDDILEEAKAELLYKINKKNSDEYNNLTLESELTFEEAIKCYRDITGANKRINDIFIKNKKDTYTIKEIIKLTKDEDEFGYMRFKDFFKKKKKNKQIIKQIIK